jgi:hypothetical protein
MFMRFLLSVKPIRQRGLDCGARMQRTEHGNRFDRLSRERGRDVIGDANETKHLDAQLRSRFPHGLEILFREVLEAEHECSSCDRLAQHVGVHGDLVPDRGTYQVGTV